MNSVSLVGRLTKDIELKKTASGLSTCSFTVAINRRKAKDADKTEADFINCVAWRGSAEYLANYGNKGDLVSVEGRIQTRNYDNPNGYKVYVTEVLANAVALLSYKNSNNSNNNSLNDEEFNNGYSVDTGFESYETGSDFGINSDDLPF